MANKAVAYIRVSREDEKAENQIIAINEFCKKYNLEVVGCFIDEAISRAIQPRQRSKYEMMLEFTKMNNIKNIIFYDVSRLGRNLEETLYELKRLLEEGYSTWFVYPEFLNKINDEMMKKFIISMLAWFAELYRYDIVQRTKAGLERARREGKRIGRPPAIPDEYLKRLLKKYLNLTKKALWKIALGEGFKISYPRFLIKIKNFKLKDKYV